MNERSNYTLMDSLYTWASDELERSYRENAGPESIKTITNLLEIYNHNELVKKIDKLKKKVAVLEDKIQLLVDLIDMKKK